MKLIDMAKAREYAIQKVKAYLFVHGKLNYEYINGVNEMLAYIDALKEVEQNELYRTSD